MFYKQFLKIIDVLDEQFLRDIDFWLTTATERETKRITPSFISAKFSVKFAMADAFLKFACKEKIIEKRYLVICSNSDCELPQCDYSENEIINILEKQEYCHNCEQEFIISSDNVIIAYNKIKEPNVSEEQIRKAIFERLGFDDQKTDISNFNFADSLSRHPDEFYSIYYNPEESAYIELERLKQGLDGPFQSKKEKGDALERFSLYLFKQIRSVSVTNEIRTYTNQFDCTVRFSQSAEIFPTIMKYMTPYFIVECKNELDKSGDGKTPSNTYFHKLSNIMSANDTQLGIVLSRGEASKVDISIAHDNYLLCRNLNRQKILLSLSDKDLVALIDKRINLLEYLGYKMDMLTIHAQNATFEMFEENKKRGIKEI